MPVDLAGMRFRETLWFKKGNSIDVVATDELDGAIEDALAPASDDLRPIEDSYVDDGSVGPRDSATYGVHTGTTQGLAKLSPAGEIAVDQHMIVSERVLARELGRTRMRLAAMATAVAAIVGVLIAMM